MYVSMIISSPYTKVYCTNCLCLIKYKIINKFHFRIPTYIMYKHNTSINKYNNVDKNVHFRT